MNRGEFIQFLYRIFLGLTVGCWPFSIVSLGISRCLNVSRLRWRVGWLLRCVVARDGWATEWPTWLGRNRWTDSKQFPKQFLISKRLWRGVSVAWQFSPWGLRFLGRKTSDTRHERMEKVLERMFWHIETIRPSLRRMPTRISQIARPFFAHAQMISNYCKLV